jgi:hypothetical protein
MKKYTLLFATMLAMSGMAFGQKEGKLVWETTVDSTFSSTLSGYYVPAKESGPLGFKTKLTLSDNFLVQYGFYKNQTLYGAQSNGVIVYDKNGKIVWKKQRIEPKGSISDTYVIGSPVGQENKNYTLLFKNTYLTKGYYRPDSTFFLDKNFNIIKGFNSNQLLSLVEDGFFYSDLQQKVLIKHDLLGNEEWRLDNSNPIYIQNNKAPYIGFTNQPSNNGLGTYFFIDNKGKRQEINDNQKAGRILVTPDKGFWHITQDFECTKFDSTGKQTAKILDYRYLVVTTQVVFPD